VASAIVKLLCKKRTVARHRYDIFGVDRFDDVMRTNHIIMELLIWDQECDKSQAYLFDAVCPARTGGTAIIMPGRPFPP
jgi:hypothetical protein